MSVSGKAGAISASRSPGHGSPRRSVLGPESASNSHFGGSSDTLSDRDSQKQAPSTTGATTRDSNEPFTRRSSQNYDEQVSLLNSHGAPHVDYKAVSKHLGKPQDTLKMPGGDVARYMHQQLGGSGRRMTRSSSFSDFQADARRESMASDINVPGGFRREFIINKSLQQNRPPPSFLTRNFVEFLSIYGQFAGEDFGSDSDAETDAEDDANSRYEDVFDEEASLMHERGIPSLPKKSRRRKQAAQGTASCTKTFFLLFKALVGSGILFLPRAFCSGGLAFSTAAMTVFGVLTYVCYIVLIRSKKILGKNSYGELGYLTHGRSLKYCIMVSIIVSQIGFVATYILFTAENVASFASNVLRVDLDPSTLFVAQCVLLIPLTLIRNLAKLSFTSATSSLFILVGLVIIFYFSGLQLFQHGVGPHIVNFNGSTWSMLIGIAVTSFEGIGLILPIEASMARPEKFPLVLSISMAAITALFVLIGVVGYSAYGENVKSIIILNLPQGNAAVQSILVLYSAAVFLTAPLQLFPAIRIGESALFNSRIFLSKDQRHTSEEGKLYRTSGKYNPHIKWMKNMFRAAVVVVITILAWANANNIDKFVSFNGCFACIPLVYIYPPLIHLKTFAKDRSQPRALQVFDYVLIVVGVVAVVYTTYQILFAM